VEYEPEPDDGYDPEPTDLNEPEPDYGNQPEPDDEYEPDNEYDDEPKPDYDEPKPDDDDAEPDDEPGYDNQPEPDDEYEHEPDDGYDHDLGDEPTDDGSLDLEEYDLDQDNEAAEPPGEEEEGEDPDEARFLGRRRFLQFLVAGGASAAGGAIIYSGRDQTTESVPVIEQPSTQVGVVTKPDTASETSGRLLAGAIENRVLVVVELAGGNDGLSTLIPYASGTYYDLRPNIAIPPEEVITLDSEVGLHPNLTRLHQRGLALIEGVGSIDGSLSHFEMVQRWDAGDIDGTNNLRSGFLARLADTIDNGSPLVGLSVGGNTPRFANSAASTLALDNLDALRYLAGDDELLQAYHESLRSFSLDESTMAGVVGSSWLQLLDLGATLSAQFDQEPDETNPMYTDGGQLGRQLGLAAELIAADVGVRVVHAALGGFDTHENHLNRHGQLMSELDASVAGFLQQMEAYGIDDRVLVATTSEFGRRVAENNRGTDHGAGSMMMVAGPVEPGRYGSPSPINGLDGNGNLTTEVPFDAYLATLAQGWLGIEAASVLPGQPEILPFL
jgi:uncharacterized protein (DUF1501 family)